VESATQTQALPRFERIRAHLPSGLVPRPPPPLRGPDDGAPEARLTGAFEPLRGCAPWVGGCAAPPLCRSSANPFVRQCGGLRPPTPLPALRASMPLPRHTNRG